MRVFTFLSILLFFACGGSNSPEFDTKSLANLFQTESIEADYFSLGTDRGHMLLVDISKSPVVDGDSVDIGNLVSSAAYLSYMQLTERKMETEKIRISLYKKVPGNTEEYSRDFPMDSLDMVSGYYSAFYDRLSSLKRGEYDGIISLLDENVVGPEAKTVFKELHDKLFASYGQLTNISFAGFDYGFNDGLAYVSITGDYEFEGARVPFVYLFSRGNVRIIGFYIEA